MQSKSIPSATLAGFCLLLLLAWAAPPPAEAQVEGDPIDLVIVLDVSGTMRGLIDATRLNIWEIVNDLAEAEPTPTLRVALVTYGNQRGSRYTGWVRVEANLTEDLDRVAERLFQLKSRGADERVGRALQTALEELDWSESEHALRFLFIAGNESADQDEEVRFRWMSEAARDREIFLSAVYCGTAEQAAAATWKEMAELAEGRFATIDHRGPITLVETPFDSELAAFGDLFDATFVPVGKQGAKEKKGRAEQDRRARSLGLPVAASRAQTKAGPLFSSRSDLVSLYESGDLGRFPIEHKKLPRSLRKMTEEERTVYLEEMQAVRQEIRARIGELVAARRAYLAELMAESGPDTRSFDRVVRQTIRDRAEAFGYTFPED